MAIIRYAGDRFVGLSTDVKPTNVKDGARFDESDTLSSYQLISSVWTLFSGFSGYSGISGFSGIVGTSGYSGVGVSGFSGYSGISGESGLSGYSGSGTSGFSGSGGGGTAGGDLQGEYPNPLVSNKIKARLNLVLYR